MAVHPSVQTLGNSVVQQIVVEPSRNKYVQQFIDTCNLQLTDGVGRMSQSRNLPFFLDEIQENLVP